MHRNAPLTVEGRLRLCLRIEDGWTIAQTAESMQVSRQTASKWWHRYCDHGVAGLEDRSSRPHHSPTKTSPRMERRIVALRQSRKLGPARLAGIVGLPASTVHAVLVRHGCNRLAWMDRPTGRVVRRIETNNPGELVHIDVKKLARIPDGGGWRAHGRSSAMGRGRERRSKGYAYVHSAIDAHSRLAYSEIHTDETATTTVEFFARAERFFAGYGIQIDAVLTDNGPNDRSERFNDALRSIEHRYTRPYHPATNGTVERYNRTLLDEWAYARVWRSDAARSRALDRWLHRYNHHRHHTAIDGPPISRANNVPGRNN